DHRGRGGRPRVRAAGPDGCRQRGGGRRRPGRRDHEGRAMTPAATAPPAAPSARGPRPAPALRRVLAHAGLETRVLLSNGEQLTVAVALPAMVLIGLWLLPLGRIPGVPSVDTAVA